MILPPLLPFAFRQGGVVLGREGRDGGRHGNR
jgi:hypothetical protein